MPSIIFLLIAAVILINKTRQLSQDSGRNAQQKGPAPAKDRSTIHKETFSSAGSRTSAVSRTSVGSRASGSAGKPSPSGRRSESAEYSGAGISFKGLPEGKDELELLIRHNHAHEKELERQLQSRDS